MAYFDNLTDSKQNEIRNQLLEKVRTEHEQAYQSNLRKAKSKLAKKRCAGRYEGGWWRLMDNWMQNKVENLHIYNCLRINTVIGDTQGVIFTPSH